MGDVWRTRQGFVMNRRLRERIVDFLGEHKGMTQKAVAEELGIPPRRLRDYLTDEVLEDIERRRTTVKAEPTLEDVDRAMMEQARSGNVAAARLVYMRMAARGEGGALPSLEELEAELVSLKKLERSVEDDDGTGADVGSAMVDDAC